MGAAAVGPGGVVESAVEACLGVESKAREGAPARLAMRVMRQAPAMGKADAGSSAPVGGSKRIPLPERAGRHGRLPALCVRRWR